MEAAVLLALALLGHLADDREHRPLDRPLHGPVGGVARTAERAAQESRAHALVPAEHLDEPTDDLREDDARVPTRAHQRRTVTSFATASLSVARDASSASTMDRSVSMRLVPVSPSGTG